MAFFCNLVCFDGFFKIYGFLKLFILKTMLNAISQTFPTSLPMPRVMSMKKKRNDQMGGMGSRVTTSGNTINANPGPGTTNRKRSTKQQHHNTPRC